MNQSHHVRAIGVHSNDVRFESGTVQRRDTDVVVRAGLELPAGGFQVGSCLLVLAVHPDGDEPFQILLVGLAEAKGDGRQRADDVLFAHGDAPSVASGDADRLAHDPLLAHGFAGNLHAVGNRFPRLEHADGQGKGVRPNVTRQRFIEQPQS